jgi:plastocyanin
MMLEVKSRALLAGRFGWRMLVWAAALADLLVHLTLVVLRHDLLALTLATFIVVGLGLLVSAPRLADWRLPGARWLATGLPGFIVLALVFADTAAYTLTGAASNLVNGEPVVDVAIPGWLGVASLAGLTAAVAAALTLRRPEAGSRAAPWVGLGGIVIFGLLLAAGLSGGQHRLKPETQGTLELQAANMAFSTKALTARSGQITVRLANSDLFWHTFNIDALGVSVQVPVGGARDVTFNAPPGIYKFYCAIPGHALIGMQGTLTVR